MDQIPINTICYNIIGMYNIVKNAINVLWAYFIISTNKSTQGKYLIIIFNLSNCTYV